MALHLIKKMCLLNKLSLSRGKLAAPSCAEILLGHYFYNTKRHIQGLPVLPMVQQSMIGSWMPEQMHYMEVTAQFPFQFQQLISSKT